MKFSFWRRKAVMLGLCSVVTATLLAAAAPTVVAQVKMAVVDTQRAAMETEEGLRATANLKKLFDKRQTELDKKQNELQQQRDDIEKQRAVLSQDAFNKRVEKWQREMMDIQSVFVEYNKELQKKQAEIMQPIMGKVLGIIRRVATQNSYDVVVEKQVVPYHRSDLDLTDRVISMYNGGADATAEPPQPGAAPEKGKVAPAVPPLAAPAPKTP